MQVTDNVQEYGKSMLRNQQENTSKKIRDKNTTRQLISAGSETTTCLFLDSVIESIQDDQDE